MQELYRVGQKFKTYRDSVSGLFTSEFTMHDQHYADEQGTWQQVVEAFEPDGLDGFLVKADKMRHSIRMNSNAGRRYYPRRNVLTEYLTLNRPQYYTGKKWTNLPFDSYAVGTNSVTFTATNYTFTVSFNWNSVNLEIKLLNSSAPKQFRMPVALTGITLTNGRLIAASDGADVGQLVPTSAQDVNGLSLPITESYSGGYLNFTVNTTGAVYPVLIDPDFAAGAVDGHIYGRDATYATAHSTSYGFSYNDTPTFIVGQNKDTFSRYLPYRGFILFDTSAIGADSTVTQVNLKMVATVDSSGVDFDVVIKKYDWSELAGAPTNTTYRETAYDGGLAATSDDNIWRNTNGISTNTQYTSGNLSTTWVSKTGTTYYSLVSSRDVSETAPTSGEYITLGSATNATEAYRPVLTVLYEEAATPDELTATDITSGVPAVDKPSIGQKHALVSKDISTPAPVVDKSTIAQIHALVSKDVASGVPAVDKPTIAQIHALTGTDVSAGVPLVDTPTIGQTHALTATDVASGIPAVDSATLGQIHALVSTDVSSGIPTVDSATIGQVHALVSTDVVSGVPTVDKPTVGEVAPSVDALTATDVVAGVPTVDKPTLKQISKRHYVAMEEQPIIVDEDEEEIILYVMEYML